jgi:hypothetical protein
MIKHRRKVNATSVQHQRAGVMAVEAVSVAP